MTVLADAGEEDVQKKCGYRQSAIERGETCHEDTHQRRAVSIKASYRFLSRDVAMWLLRT